MTTRAPLTEAEKLYIQKRKEAGAPLREIAAELDCAYETARKWWRYQRDGKQAAARGRPAKGILSTYPEQVRTEAINIKRAHPHWGPANVKLEMKERLSLTDEELPSDARLSGLFKAKCPEAVQPRQRRTYPEKPPPTAIIPHQCWQTDTKEGVRLGDDDVANILEVRDPFAAFMIASQAFVTTSEKHWRKLTLQEIQHTLRQAFVQWGLPLSIQTDREVVYVGSADRNFPSPFTLWLIGLGIQHILCRSRRPTDQAQVERNHRTLGDMAWKDQPFDHLDQLQLALDASRQRYNQDFPVEAAHCNGRPPLQVYPWANFSGRPYHPGLEWQVFDLERVDRYLAQGVWTRKVSETGVVTVADHRYYVGRAFQGQTVSVRFLPGSRSFRFEAPDGSVLHQWPAVGFDKADLIGFMPADYVLPTGYQLPLLLVGV